MQHEIRTLRNDDFDAVFEGFSQAFSDYVVPLTLQREGLREMMTRRGYVPELSAAAFAGDRIVSFILNCLDGERGYNMGTGTIPQMRKAGLSRKILDVSCNLLREAGASEYWLEVIESNTPAARLYESSGFRESRRFQCWSLPPWNGAPELSRLDRVPLGAEEWWDVQPSWQNNAASLSRASDECVVTGDERGYAVVFPSTGDLPQLAVARAHRRNGVGTRLLRSASAIAGKALRMLNIDDRDTGIAMFLENAGAIRTVRQIEMIRDLAERNGAGLSRF